MNVNDIFDSAIEFKETTPKGNRIEGLINKKRNRNLGSLLITKINGIDTYQYVQGFPKIHYWDKDNQVNNSMYAFEKYDGSCICVYPLKDNNGNIIELVPKSRGLPILDKNLQSMYNLVEKHKIIEFFERDINKNSQLFFELYGVKNIHSIKHMDTYIDLALIGGVKNISLDNNEVYREFFNGVDVLNTASIYYFNRPSFLFKIEKALSNNEYLLIIKDDFRAKYSYYYESKKAVVGLPTVYDCILKIREILEEVNNNYKKINYRIATEGVVLNGQFNDFQKYIKIKPNTIKKEAIAVNGIPRKYIIKEINKYFDEYGSTAKEDYLNNPEKIWNYVSDNLKEEFDNNIVEDIKNQRRIKKIFLQVADAKEAPESINNIANELVAEYPQESIPNLMRIFSQKYPFKKKDARILYSVLSDVKRKGTQ